MKNHNRSLLFDESPVAVSPTLCRLLSLEAAYFLQQVHYWLQHKSVTPDKYKDHFINGRYWVYWTYEQLKASVPIGKSTDIYKRLIKELKLLGILKVEQHRAAAWDRTNFYSIDYECLDQFIKINMVKDGSSSSVNSTARDSTSSLVDKSESNQSISEELADYKETKKTTKTSSKNITTTTTTFSLNEIDNLGLGLILDESAERYRSIIERATRELSKESAQLVADEVSGSILAIEKGVRKPVYSYRHWITSLSESAAKGELAAQFGPDVASMRGAAKLAAVISLKKQSEEEEAKRSLSLDLSFASNLLAKIDEQSLLEVARRVEAHFPIPSLKKHVSDALISRKLPDGPGCSVSIKILKAFAENNGGPHEHRV